MQKILFVDDETAFWDNIKRLLHKQKKTWELSFAENVDEALALCRDNEFDTIVSDVKMPDKTGFDLLERLQADERTRAIPVIMLTGAWEENLKLKALEMGAADLLNKPVNYGDLLARIKSCLRIQSYQARIIRHNVTLEQKVKERTCELEKLHLDIIWRLAKAGEFRDEETGDHVIRVGHFSRIIAERLGFCEKETDLIFLTAPLHDLGKIGITDSILLKGDKLKKSEWAIMKEHCRIGASILLESPKGMRAFRKFKNLDIQKSPLTVKDEIRQAAAVICQSHHERWNGKGYPAGLKGKEIPIYGRIVAFADVYDALRSNRPYKNAFSRKKSWNIIEQSIGSQFDPDIFEVIKDIQDEFEAVREEHNG